jgi:small conductance mechanosensitive channel
MQEFLDNIDIAQYMPAAIAWATNILLAMLILLIGLWLSNKAYKAVHAIGKKYERLDDTLFRFFGSIARYVILAFVFIAVLNRFGVETTSYINAELSSELSLNGILIRMLNVEFRFK